MTEPLDLNTPEGIGNIAACAATRALAGELEILPSKLSSDLHDRIFTLIGDYLGERVEILRQFDVVLPKMMQWVITEDHSEQDDLTSRVGVGNWPPAPGYRERRELIEQLPTGELDKALPVKFRLLDDDGEVMYSGQLNSLSYPEHIAFAPLDFGGADAGCTTMEYSINGLPWTTL